MNNFKLIATDLDGTLLDDNARVSDENLRAIENITSKGVTFVLSSGRTLSEIPDNLKNNASIRYITFSNGAVVYDKHTGQKTCRCISNSLVREILDVLKRLDSHITIRFDGMAYVDSKFQTSKWYEYYNVCVPHQRVVKDFAAYCDNFAEISYSADNVEVVSVFFHDYNDKLYCKKLFEANPFLRVVEVSEYNIEIVNTEAGKGNALQTLCDMLSIDTCDVVSVGDSDNDKSMVELAGMGLAVSNACNELKEVADGVICSNEEHIVPFLISHYF